MPIKARNATSFENLAGWRRRNPRLSTAIAAAVLATICGLAGTTWQWQNAEKNAKAAKLAVIEQKRATAAEELAKQNALDALDDSAVFLQFLSEQVLGAARPVGLGRGQGKDVTILEALKSADPGSYKAFEARPVAEAQAREALGTTWRMLGRFDLAAQQVAEALRLKLENLGELDHRTILSQVEHANILAANGRLEEAGASYQILLERCLDELGDDHRLTIGCKNNLASVLMKTSRFREALPLFEEVWEQITEKEGPNHTGSLQVTRNYAACLRRNHRLRRCRELIEEQIKYVRAELGENDYRTISAIGELGETLIVEGKPKLAEPLLKEALQLASTHLGPTHPKTIDIMFFSMENLLALGHVDEARELARDAIELCRETFGPAHHQTLNGERWQINELYRYGHDQAALDLIEEFLPRCSAIDTPAARRMELTLITDRIRTLGRVGRYRESNELMKRSLDRLTAGLGEDHIMLLGCFQQVGDNYLALKDFERSRRAFAHLQKQIERGELDQPRAQLTAGFAALGLARSLHFLNDFPMAISNAQSAIGYFHGSVESPIWEVAARGQLAASRLQRGQSKSDEDLETLESTHRELQNHADVDNPNLNHRMVLKESRDLLLDYYTQINDAQRVAELEAEAERFSE